MRGTMPPLPIAVRHAKYRVDFASTSWFPRNYFKKMYIENSENSSFWAILWVCIDM